MGNQSRLFNSHTKGSRQHESRGVLLRIIIYRLTEPLKNMKPSGHPQARPGGTCELIKLGKKKKISDFFAKDAAANLLLYWVTVKCNPCLSQSPWEPHREALIRSKELSHGAEGHSVVPALLQRGSCLSHHQPRCHQPGRHLSQAELQELWGATQNSLLTEPS